MNEQSQPSNPNKLVRAKNLTTGQIMTSKTTGQPLCEIQRYNPEQKKYRTVRSTSETQKYIQSYNDGSKKVMYKPVYTPCQQQSNGTYARNTLQQVKSNHSNPNYGGAKKKRVTKKKTSTTKKRVTKKKTTVRK